MNNLFTILMFAVILVSKTIVYIFGFQNSPGLFFVPVIVKIGISWILLSKFEPNFLLPLDSRKVDLPPCVLPGANLDSVQGQEEDGKNIWYFSGSLLC